MGEHRENSHNKFFLHFYRLVAHFENQQKKNLRKSFLTPI